MDGVQRQQQVVAIPDDIDTPRAKLVYFALGVLDGASTAELQDVLSMQKLALLSILDALSKRGLVEEDGSEYRHASVAAS